MALSYGGSDIKKIYIGENPVRSIYKGSNCVWKGLRDSSFTVTALVSGSPSSNSRGAFISPQGNIFATDWSSKCVRIYNPSGTEVRNFTPLSGKIPYDVSGDEAYIYIDYWDSQNIYKYSYSGTNLPTLIDTFTISHVNNGGMVIYKNYLYVTSLYDHIISRIDLSNGNVSEIITTTYDITDMAIDDCTQHIIVATNGGQTSGNNKNAIILAYDMSGNLIKSKTLSGTLASSVNGAQGIAVDQMGNIYIAAAYTTSGGWNNVGLLVLDPDLDKLYDVPSYNTKINCYLLQHDDFHHQIYWTRGYYTSPIYIYKFNDITGYLPENPVLDLWPKNSTTGTSGIKDVSGNNFHGTASGNTTIVNDGTNGSCFFFDGDTSSKINVSNASFLSALNGSSGYTISMTAKCTNSERPRAGGLVTSNSSLSGFFYFFTDHINFYDRMSSSSDELKSLVSDTNSITSGVYHTATATVDYSAGTAILYIDGVEAKRSTNWHSGGTKNITTGLKLGGNSTASTANFIGFIKNVRIYNRVLTSTEISTLQDSLV